MAQTVSIILNDEDRKRLVHHRPGITEAEIAEAMFGVREQPGVRQDCDLLESKGLIERRDTPDL